MSEIPINNHTNERFTTFLGQYVSFYTYLDSYKSAFDALIEKVYQSEMYVDHLNLAYPILFIARHCMELGFKMNIRYFAKYSESDDTKKSPTHNLVKLFNTFKLCVKITITNLDEKYGIKISEGDINEFNTYCQKVEELTNLFDFFDKTSESFRYPVDKGNNNLFGPEHVINILDVKELYEKSMLLLTHTANLFGKYIDFVNEIERTYEAEMRESMY